MDTRKSEVWRNVMVRLRVCVEVMNYLRARCPDPQQDPVGARSNLAARAALTAAKDIITNNPPNRQLNPVMDGHWAGLMDAATRIISTVELQVFDPRLYPERYGKGGEKEK